MSALTIVAVKIKKYFAVGIVLIVLSIVFKLVISIIGGLTHLFTVTTPLQAQNGYGQLPNISINPLQYIQAGGHTVFQLETPSGTFPTEQPIADVYKYGSVGLNPLSVDQAQKLATIFGFPNQYEQLSANYYHWKKGSKDFLYNLNSNQFNLQMSGKAIHDQIISDTNTTGLGSLNGALILTKDGSSTAAAQLLANTSITSDFDLQNPQVVYLNYAPDGTLSVLPDTTGANAIKIIFSRKFSYLRTDQNSQINDNKLPVIGDNPLDGNVTITIDSDGASPLAGILDMKFNDWPIQINAFSTYFIKSPSQAWQDTQDGKSYLVSLVKQGANPYVPYAAPLIVSKFQAEDISLAYFDGIIQQNYLEPIYIIKGTAILQNGTSATFYFYDSAILK